MPLVDDTISWLMTNWWAAIGLLAVGLLAYWILDERKDADDPSETIEGVGERADSFFGVGLGAFGSLVVVVISIVITIGNQFAMLGGELVELATNGPPLLLSNLAGTLLAYAGLSGLVPVNATAYAIVVLALIVVAYGWRERRAGA